MTAAPVDSAAPAPLPFTLDAAVDEMLRAGPTVAAARAAESTGSGLGLSIVAAIVNLHGFTLEVGSSEQGGARLALDCRATLL